MVADTDRARCQRHDTAWDWNPVITGKCGRESECLSESTVCTLGPSRNSPAVVRSVNVEAVCTGWRGCRQGCRIWARAVGSAANEKENQEHGAAEFTAMLGTPHGSKVWWQVGAALARLVWGCLAYPKFSHLRMKWVSYRLLSWSDCFIKLIIKLSQCV